MYSFIKFYICSMTTNNKLRRKNELGRENRRTKGLITRQIKNVIINKSNG